MAGFRGYLSAGIQGPGSGYYRGAPPKAGGTGSMAGPAGAGTRTQSATGPAWHPTVAYLLGLVVVEVGLFALLRYVFRTAHGG